MRGLWPLVGMVAVFPALLIVLWWLGDEQRLLEFFPALAMATSLGIVGLIALYRERKDPDPL